MGAYYAFAWDMLPRKLDEQSAALLSNLDAAKVFGTPVSAR
ncbi:hypothetical protein ACIBF7_10550 [Nonomuraea sp. NPDC050478]